MKPLIGYCGLDCEACDARIATVNCDRALREKTAKLWSQLNGVEITPEMITCVGCRAEGPKTPYCEALCPIRSCARAQGFASCGECGGLDKCEKVGAIHDGNPQAKENLKG